MVHRLGRIQVQEDNSMNHTSGNFTKFFMAAGGMACLLLILLPFASCGGCVFREAPAGVSSGDISAERLSGDSSKDSSGDSAEDSSGSFA